MTASPGKGSKVFELLEGGAAERKAGRKKLNVFARRGNFNSCGFSLTNDFAYIWTRDLGRNCR